jgi:hypothetical protein
MDDFDKQWWLHLENPMQVVPIERELCRICNLATSRENAANALLVELHGIGNAREIMNPIVPCTKGRPRGGFNQTTRREPSAFEHVEGVAGRRRCRNCNGIGHNARTCNRNQAE